jgi:hypothetical protein
MSRDIGFWDTGEMQTVPFMLGLAHPTGYPAEILFGWLFTHLVPIGDPAIRMNLFCVICVVGSTAACCELAQSFGASPLVSALCASPSLHTSSTAAGTPSNGRAIILEGRTSPKLFEPRRATQSSLLRGSTRRHLPTSPMRNTLLVNVHSFHLTLEAQNRIYRHG